MASMAETKERLGLDEDEGEHPNPEIYAAIMAANKPDVMGPGYIKLYLLAGTIFLCSTMTGITHTHIPPLTPMTYFVQVTTAH